MHDVGQPAPARAGPARTPPDDRYGMPVRRSSRRTGQPDHLVPSRRSRAGSDNGIRVVATVTVAGGGQDRRLLLDHDLEPADVRREVRRDQEEPHRSGHAVRRLGHDPSRHQRRALPAEAPWPRCSMWSADLLGRAGPVREQVERVAGRRGWCAASPRHPGAVVDRQLGAAEAVAERLDLQLLRERHPAGEDRDPVQTSRRKTHMPDWESRNGTPNSIRVNVDSARFPDVAAGHRVRAQLAEPVVDRKSSRSASNRLSTSAGSRTGTSGRRRRWRSRRPRQFAKPAL